MQSLLIRLIAALCLLAQDSIAESNLNKVPVLYEGRYIPMSVYAERLFPGNKEEKSRHRLAQAFCLHVLSDDALEHFLMLPDKIDPDIWHPLRRLDRKGNEKNFTAYKDEHFKAIKEAYSHLKGALAIGSYEGEANHLADMLLQAYSTIENTPYRKTASRTLRFPSIYRLQLENRYSSFPWTPLLIASYTLSLLLLFIPNRKICYLPLAMTFALHTFVLVVRSYLLNRPPVANMAETVLFVPWISIMAGAFLSYFYRSKTPLVCASASASLLFSILQVSGVSLTLENVPAVLNSQFWLTIHVLMVVGSYGAFLLAGLLAHVYLFAFLSKKNYPLLSQLTLQSIYLGLALLIPGTILGGIWAAQSWGRFWDWDPKESWAFISCCTYLALVHAHYFGVIKHFGLAIGSVMGLMVVAFTWYGVNYLLGTGLHSYGFGHGGELYFYVYLAIEIIFLALNAAIRYTSASCCR